MLANQQIVFIDSQVADYQLLANGVLPGIEVVILKSDKPSDIAARPIGNPLGQRDGISQITEILNQKLYSTVHIVSHGSPGCLYLGNTQLSLDTLAKHKSDLKTWFSSSFLFPCPKGYRFAYSSILIYGCNVAAGDAGEEFITKLHNITGAEIAASTTVIGNADLGGNWELDITTNNVSNKLAINESVQQAYTEILSTISGTVFTDYDDDGTQETGNDAVESGYEGITVTAYLSDGSALTTTTASDGSYSLNNASNLAARVEFSDLPDNFLGSSLVNPDANTVASVFFNDGSNQTANFGIFNPNEYVDSSASPDLITTCFVLGSFNGSLSGDTAIVSVLHSASGTSPTKTSHATIGEVGSVVGLAVSKETSDIFAGAFQTRFSDIGPEGNAAIYRIDGTTGNVSTFINLEDFFGTDIAGEYSHGDNQTLQDSIDGNIDWNADKDAFAAVGKVALGDVEISEDRQYIYTVNLADRKVYKIQIGADEDSTATIDYTAGDTRTIETFDIPAGGVLAVR